MSFPLANIKTLLLGAAVAGTALIGLYSLSKRNKSNGGCCGCGSSSTSTTPFVRKLYIYEHCPFCIRVRILIGAKHIPVEIKYLFHDDEKGHIDLIGKKMVPILEYEPGKHMGESLDIIKYLDSLPEYGPPSLSPPSDKLKPHSPFPDSLGKLGLIALQNAQFPEFGRQSARDYFLKKKLGMASMTMEQLLAAKPQLIQDLDKHLLLISTLLPSVEQFRAANNYYANGVSFSIDDITLYAPLCYTSMLKGLTVPDNVKLYVDYNAKRWNTPLFYDVAV